MQHGGPRRRGAGRLVDHRCGTPRGWCRAASGRGVCPWHRDRPRAGARARGPEPPQLGQRAEGLVEPTGQPGVTVGVGVEVVGLDGQPGRIQPVVGVGRVDDVREARGPRHGQDGAVLGRLGRLADAGDQHPDDRHAPRRPVGRHGAVDAGQDLAMMRLERVLVLARDSSPARRRRRPARRGTAASRSPAPGPARSGAAARPSRCRPRSTRRSPGRAASASRPAGSGASAGRAHGPARRSRGPRPRARPRAATARPSRARGSTRSDRRR